MYPTSTFPDPSKELLAVKAVNDIAGSTAKTLTFPDFMDAHGKQQIDAVVSMQPDGTVQTRPKGQDGGYERCAVSGNLATWEPIPGVRHTRAFVVVGQP